VGTEREHENPQPGPISDSGDRSNSKQECYSLDSSVTLMSCLLACLLARFTLRQTVLFLPEREPQIFKNRSSSAYQCALSEIQTNLLHHLRRTYGQGFLLAFPPNRIQVGKPEGTKPIGRP
jgi:hypothetical protein